MEVQYQSRKAVAAQRTQVLRVLVWPLSCMPVLSVIAAFAVWIQGMGDGPTTLRWFMGFIYLAIGSAVAACAVGKMSANRESSSVRRMVTLIAVVINMTILVGLVTIILIGLAEGN